MILLGTVKSSNGILTGFFQDFLIFRCSQVPSEIFKDPVRDPFHGFVQDFGILSCSEAIL